MSRRRKLKIILERKDARIWGRIFLNGNLIVDSAGSIHGLEKNLKKTLKNFESIDDEQFEHVYDLTYFFEKFNFLNQSKIAELAGIHPALIRQYSSGNKQPSPEQVSKIENAIHQLGYQLSTVHLSAKVA